MKKATPEEAGQREIKRRERNAAIFERARTELRTLCEDVLSRTALENFGAVECEADLWQYASRAGEYVAATLLLHFDSCKSPERTARDLNNGLYGEAARKIVIQYTKRRKDDFEDPLVINEKALRERTTGYGKLNQLLVLNGIKFAKAFRAGEDVTAIELIPDYIMLRISPRREDPQDTAEPLTLAEALFRDQLDYWRREEARGREAFERRDAIERAACERQAEARRGTAADRRTLAERASNEMLAVMNRALVEVDALRTGHAQTALRALMAESEVLA